MALERNLTATQARRVARAYREAGAVAGDTAVEEGDVVTLEPGLYVPGIGGVRCEDNYLITSAGPERLTDFERKIRWYKP